MVHAVREVNGQRSAATEANHIDVGVAGKHVLLELLQCFDDTRMAARARDATQDLAERPKAGADAFAIKALGGVRPPEPEDVCVVLRARLVAVPCAVKRVERHYDDLRTLQSWRRCKCLTRPVLRSFSTVGTRSSHPQAPGRDEDSAGAGCSASSSCECNRGRTPYRSRDAS